MADSKITALTSIGASTDPANDPLVLVDVSDTSMAASGTTKKVTLNQLLGASGTATLASATITGDLTVDTNVLKVDTSNNRVGINTATPVDALHVVGAARFGSTNFAGIGADATGSYIECASGTQVFRINTNGAERYRLDSTGVATWSVGGSTAMTLNSTGLGVGESPVTGQKLTVNGAGSIRNANKFYLWDSGNATAHGIYNSGDNLTFFKNNSTASMTLDASGNLSLGQSSSALQSGGTGITLFGTSASEIKFLNSTTGSTASDGTAIVTTGNNFSINNRESGFVSIGTSNTERVSVKTNGQVRFVPLAADPVGAETGDVYYNSTSNKLKCYNGTTWNDLF